MKSVESWAIARFLLYDSCEVKHAHIEFYKRMFYGD